MKGRGISKEKIYLMEKYRLFSEFTEYVREVASKEGYKDDVNNLIPSMAVTLFPFWYQKHMIIVRREYEPDILML